MEDSLSLEDSLELRDELDERFERQRTFAVDFFFFFLRCFTFFLFLKK